MSESWFSAAARRRREIARQEHQRLAVANARAEARRLSRIQLIGLGFLCAFLFCLSGFLAFLAFYGLKNGNNTALIVGGVGLLVVLVAAVAVAANAFGVPPSQLVALFKASGAFVKELRGSGSQAASEAGTTPRDVGKPGA